MGITPFVEGIPKVGFSTQSADTLAGAIKDPSVSVPREAIAKLAAMATAEPELEPSGSAPRL